MLTNLFTIGGEIAKGHGDLIGEPINRAMGNSNPTDGENIETALNFHLTFWIAGSMAKSMGTGMFSGYSSGISTNTTGKALKFVNGRTLNNSLKYSQEELATLYRNFGWNELKSIKEFGGKFSILPSGFQGKQFWVGESGKNMWLNSKFSKPFTAEISIPKSYVTPGNANYIFLEKNMIIDNRPGGTILPQNLSTFNSVMKINHIDYTP